MPTDPVRSLRERLSRLQAPTQYDPSCYGGDPEIDGLEARVRQSHAGRAAEMEGWLRRAEERAAQPDVTADDIEQLRPVLERLRAQIEDRKRMARGDRPQTQYAGADEGTVNHFLAQLQSPEHDATRWGHPEGDHTLRQVAADALQDNGRDDEAEHLRTPGRHVMVHQGRVVPGRWDTSRLLADHILPIQQYVEQFDTTIPPWIIPEDVGGHEIDHGWHDVDLGDDPPPEGTHYPPGTVRFPDDDGGTRHMHASKAPAWMARQIPDYAGYEPGADHQLDSMLLRLRKTQVEFPDVPPSGRYTSPDSFTVYADDYPVDEPEPDDSLELPEADGERDDGHAERMRDRYGDDWGRGPQPQQEPEQYAREDYACGPAGADPCALRGRLEALKDKLCGPTEYGTGEDLLAGVRDNPDDHNARLVAADWMQENNRPHEEAVLRDLATPTHVHPQGWAVAQGPASPPLGAGMGFGAWADRAPGVTRQASDRRTTALWARKNAGRRFPEGWTPPQAGTGAFNPPPQPLPGRDRGEQYADDPTEYGTGEDLLAAVQANPDSHDHRLVAADWFAENDRPYDESLLRDLNSPVYVHPQGWVTADQPTQWPEHLNQGGGFGRTLGHDWYVWQYSPEVRRRARAALEDREYRLPPGGAHPSGVQHLPWNGLSGQVGDPKPMAGTGAFAPPPGGPPKRVRGPKPYAATPYRYPTDDYGNITGIMTPVGQDTFLGGKWGPKPKQRGVGYARDGGRTDYAAHEDFARLFRTDPLHQAALWHDPEVDHTPRHVAADAYEEAGDPESAEHLRGTGHVAVSPKGRIVPARFTAYPYRSLLAKAGVEGIQVDHVGGQPVMAHMHNTDEPPDDPDYPLGTFRVSVGGEPDGWGGIYTYRPPHDIAEHLALIAEGQGAAPDHVGAIRNQPPHEPEPAYWGTNYSRTAYGDREDLEAFFHHVNAPWASHGEQDAAARSGLADWLAERGRDDEANWAADLAHPVGVSHGRVGPGARKQLDRPAGAYLIGLGSGPHSPYPTHPDTVASAHNTMKGFLDASGDIHGEADPARASGREFYLPADFRRARNRQGGGFLASAGVAGSTLFHPDTARRLNALSRRFGRHTVQPHLIGDKMQLIHEGGFHTPLPEDPDPDYETDHGYASPDGPTNYDDSQDFETFANHVRANQGDRGAREAFSDWLRDRGRDEEADHLTRPPAQKLAPSHAHLGPYQLVGFHKGRVGPGHVTGLDPWAKEYIQAAFDTETLENPETGNTDTLGDHYLADGAHIHPDTVAAVHHTTNEFRQRAGHILDGHDDHHNYGPYHFLTTRNGHGTGFWADPEYWNTPGGNEAAELTDHAHAMGEHRFYVGDDDMIHSHEEGHYEDDQAPAMYADDDQYEPAGGERWVRDAMPSEMPPPPPAPPPPDYRSHLLPDPEDPARKALDLSIPATMRFSANLEGIGATGVTEGGRSVRNRLSGHMWHAGQGFDNTLAANKAWNEGRYEDARFHHYKAAEAHGDLVEPGRHYGPDSGWRYYRPDAPPYDNEDQWHPDHQNLESQAHQWHSDAAHANFLASLHAPEGGPRGQLSDLLHAYLQTGDATPLHAAADLFQENGVGLGASVAALLSEGDTQGAFERAHYGLIHRLFPDDAVEPAEDQV